MFCVETVKNVIVRNYLCRYFPLSGWISLPTLVYLKQARKLKEKCKQLEEEKVTQQINALNKIKVLLRF